MESIYYAAPVLMLAARLASLATATATKAVVTALGKVVNTCHNTAEEGLTFVPLRHETLKVSVHTTTATSMGRC